MRSSTTPPPTRRRRARSALVVAVAAAAVVGTAASTAGPAAASSHREAPGIAGTPRLDTTDVYAFLSPDKAGTVTLAANWLPFSDPTGGPNFYTFGPFSHYDINVDTNGDAKADYIYRWDFTSRTRNGNTFLYNTGPVTSLTDPDLNSYQTYTLTRWGPNGWVTLAKDKRVAPSNVGKASFPDYAKVRQEAVYDLGGGRKTFAGQADDPFFVDLRVFDLLYGGDLSEVGDDTLAGYNVNSVALQVPVSELGGAKNVIGVWSTTTTKGADNAWRQVSRLGNPLVNEVVIPVKDKDLFNRSLPANDAQFLPYVTKPELPRLIEGVYGIKAPAEPRNDLVQVFLTGVPGVNQPAKVTPSEMLRLNLTPFANQTPSRLGVVGGDLNGFPNGRRLSDDVLDAALQVAEGELVGSPNDLGDGVDANDKAFGTTFPYLALPHSGSSVAAAQAKSENASLVSPLEGGKPDAVVSAGMTGAPVGQDGTTGAWATTAALLGALVSGGALVTLRSRRRAGSRV